MNIVIKTENSLVTDIVEAVRKLPVIKAEDAKFLQENSKHLTQVLENTHMWRTDEQKRQILNDFHFPTIHAKFHQAMLEQKVQFDQAMYLAKDFEVKKLEIEELECDIEELGDSKRDDIKRRKFGIELQFKQYELKQLQIAMDYRMKELKGWQDIQNNLLAKMRDQGIDEQAIWSKDEGEITAMFFHALNQFASINTTTDSAERGNLIAAATHAVNRVKESGRLEELKGKCNELQLASLMALGL